MKMNLFLSEFHNQCELIPEDRWMMTMWERNLIETKISSAYAVHTYRKPSIIWQLLDSNASSHPYLIAQNATTITSGAISPNTPIYVNLDGLTAGDYNYTIKIIYDTTTILQDSAIVHVFFEPFAIDGMPSIGVFIGICIGIGITWKKPRKHCRIWFFFYN